MTFGEFVLKLRNRLNDSRDYSGVIITDPSLSGIRWSSQKLIDIANDAMSEATRLIATYPQSPIMQILSNLQIASEETLSPTSSGVIVLDDDILAVISVGSANNPGYGYVPPQSFRVVAYNDKSPRKGEHFYTMVYNKTAKRKELLFTPADTDAKTCMVIFSQGGGYTASNFGDNILLTGLNDFLLDIAEREAREQEHNLDRAKILDRRISIKLGIGG